MGTQSLSVTSRNNRSSDPSPESYTASSYATEFAVNETRFDDPVDFIARILESREKELPPAKVKEARAKLKEIAASCKTPRRRRRP